MQYVSSTIYQALGQGFSTSALLILWVEYWVPLRLVGNIEKLVFAIGWKSVLGIYIIENNGQLLQNAIIGFTQKMTPNYYLIFKFLADSLTASLAAVPIPKAIDMDLIGQTWKHASPPGQG